MSVSAESRREENMSSSSSPEAIEPDAPAANAEIVLMPEALIGLSEIALDSGLVYVSGGVMIDERFWQSVIGTVEALDDLVRKSHQADLHDVCSTEADDDSLESPLPCDCEACTAGQAWREAYSAIRLKADPAGAPTSDGSGQVKDGF